MIFAEYITALRNAIRTNFGCESVHLRTEQVELIHNDTTVWEGRVESFALPSCEKGNQCYGWGIPREEGRMDYVTVLRVPPVTGPSKAVEAYLLGRHKSQ